MNIAGLKFHRTPHSFSISAGGVKAIWGKEPKMSEATQPTDDVLISSKQEQAEALEEQVKGLESTSTIYHWTSKAALTAGMGLALMGGAALGPLALSVFGAGLLMNGMARDCRSTAMGIDERAEQLRAESSLAQQPQYFADNFKTS